MRNRYFYKLITKLYKLQLHTL